MNRRLRILSCLIFILFYGDQAKPQGDALPNVEFVPVQLSLGMAKGKVITLLAESYSVSPWKGDGRDSWGIAEQAPDKNGNRKIVGFLTFDHGQLIRVGRYWGTSDKTSDTVHQIASVLKRLNREGFTTCLATTREENAPNLDHEILAINCPRAGAFGGVLVDSSHSEYQGSPVNGTDVIESLEK